MSAFTGQVTRVSYLELFFDLVFIFAITVTTVTTATDLTGIDLYRGLLVLALLWWAWVGYSWLGTTVRVDEGSMVILFLIAMGAMLVVTVLVPNWYAGDSAALLAALAYVGVRVLHLLLFWRVGRGNAELRAATLRLAAGVGVGAVLLITGAIVGGTAQVVLVTLAVVLDFGGALLGGGRGWVVSIPHFAERYGLIIIIALGEAIIATGIASISATLTLHVAVPIVIAFALTAAIWWAYFRSVAGPVEHAIAAAAPARQPALARDVYSYLHLLPVIGIFLMALALKKVIGKVDAKGLLVQLYDVPAFALGAGVVLILLSLILMRLRTGTPVPVTAWIGLGIAIIVGALAMTLPAVLVAAGMFVAIAVAARRPAA
ncbi:MAG: low temperature requirement protein A [Gaiellales bacterium]